tara:strand:- start:1535 stop:2128 length:594 start_codon:yes stop_codon:yes gene_type:complete
MVNIYPSLYRIGAASCGALTTIPFDIMQTKIISNQNIEFKLEEFKWMFFMTALFAIQNGVYDWSKFINSHTIRGALSGIVASPIYIYLEMCKFKSRLGLYPKLKQFAFWITLREIIVFVTMYNIFLLNIPYAKFISAFFANSFGFPLRVIAFKKAYPTLTFNNDSIKKTGILEIIKSSIGDGLTLMLIYNFKYSPIK